MPPLAPSEVRAIIEALTSLYVDGGNDGHWHVYRFTLRDGSAIRGRVVALNNDDGIVVGLDEPGDPQKIVPWHDVDALQVEAE